MKCVCGTVLYDTSRSAWAQSETLIARLQLRAYNLTNIVGLLS